MWQMVLTGLVAATTMAAKQPDVDVVPGSRSSLSNLNSLYGPTGLVVIPTAYTTENRTVRVSSSFGRGVRGPAANWGILPFIEVGGAVLDRDGLDTKAIANAKVTIIPSNFRNFELGIGIIDAVDAIDQTWYAVGSVDLLVTPANSEPLRIRAHGGVGTGMFGEKFFGGGELIFRERLILSAEWDTKEVNAAARYRWNDNFSLQAGIHHKNVFFGMSYTMRF